MKTYVLAFKLLDAALRLEWPPQTTHTVRHLERPASRLGVQHPGLANDGDEGSSLVICQLLNAFEFQQAGGQTSTNGRLQNPRLLPGRGKAFLCNKLLCYLN